ncbi:MAG: signal peptidase I [Coriobacteriaceae bacterium]|nr:signal peptidase I [Coriobacteriaceae bacterium]
MSFWRWLGELVVLVAAAWLLAAGIKTYVVQPFVIPSGSMVPTLEISDRVLVSKFLYRFREPSPGDIVVFLEPGGGTRDYIKRVVAVEGQTVDIDSGALLVDGEAVSEPYAQGQKTDDGDVRMPYEVPEGQVFLMGDNRANSRDSRWFGAQPVTSVLGRAFAIYWPPSRLSVLR